MHKPTRKTLNLNVLIPLAFSLMVAQAFAESSANQPNKMPPSVNAAKDSGKPGVARLMPQIAEPTSPAKLMQIQDLAQTMGSKQRLTRKEKKEQKQQLREELDNAPLLAEILRLKWDVEPMENPGKDPKRLGLDKVFHDTLANSISVRQAEVQVKDAVALAKDTHEPIFNINPLNPFEPGSYKQAAESNADAARAHVETVRQQELLNSAKLYGNLTQAFLGKYLAFQAIEQGRVQLKEEQSRFISGETNRFDVTQTQVALLDRYGRYLEADNVFHTASMVMAQQVNIPAESVLVPDIVEVQSDHTVHMFKLIPDNLELGQVLKALKNRPDLREVQARQAAMEKLIKASTGLDKQKRTADLHQLELEGEKLNAAARVLAEKAFNEYCLSKKTLEMAKQRADLGDRYLYQLQVSHTSGFSSAKEVLDGQIEVAKIKTALIGAQWAYNLSQIQLLYEMGQLNEQTIDHSADNTTVNAL